MMQLRKRNSESETDVNEGKCGKNLNLRQIVWNIAHTFKPACNNRILNEISKGVDKVGLIDFNTPHTHTHTHTHTNTHTQIKINKINKLKKLKIKN